MPRTRLLAAAVGLAMTVSLFAPLAAAAADADSSAPGAPGAAEASGAPAAGGTGLPEQVPGLGARAAAGSVLGYQCSPGVCLIDPDRPGATPVQVTADGRFAGVSADGSTVAWVQTGVGLVTAPTTGGAPRLLYDGFVGNQPVMSPDGTRFLWDYGVPVCLDFGCYYYTTRFDATTGEVTQIATCSCVITHGWAGTTSIAVFTSTVSAGVPARICRIDSGPGDSCLAELASETRGQLAFPDGTADGSLFVASVDPDASEFGGSQGPISLYSGATGTVVKDLTAHPTDTTPTLSQEGDRVAFERDGSIVVHDIATGAERVVATGVYPSWGGTSSGAGGDSTVRVKGKKLRLAGKRIALRVACAGAQRCTGRATLGTGKRVLAKGRYSVKAGTTAKARLTLTERGRARFGDRAGRPGRARTARVALTLAPAAGKRVRTKVIVRY